MKIRNADGGVSEVRVKFEVEVGSGRWVNIYESAAGKAAPGETLSIVHRDGAPNEYEVSSPPGNPPRKLGAAETMVPFAGSDFWIADLGLEFLHWPQQMVLKQEMRRSRSCNVLSSVNPHPSAGGYSRVVSWMDIESGGVVLAQAFDAQDKLLKEFAPKEMKKVQGQWQLEEMEIRNLQTGSRTRVQFDLDR